MTHPTNPVQVSCIVPAYNEGARIGAVLHVLTEHPLIHEIIVVDDCSTDDTAAVAKGFDDVTVVCLATNAGKTHALSVGFAASVGEMILLVDADLIGLDAPALTALLRPVLDDQADVSISLRRNAPKLWHILGIDYISGERVLRRELLDDHFADLKDLPRFGFEVWLNDIAIAAASRISVVSWHGVDSPAKATKRGFIGGVVADVRMIVDMVQTVSLRRLARQIVAMRRLRV